jgi:hypothetical protein
VTVPTVVELGIAPTLAAAATLAARRWGARVGGVLSAFPAIVGPVLLITALEHGRPFAARAANGTLLGLVALSAFAVVYARTAARCRWGVSLALGWAGAATAATCVGLCARHMGPPAGVLVAIASLIAARRALPRPVNAPAVRDPLNRARGAIPLRMAATALLVTTLSAASGQLGALAGGMLAALPVLVSVLVVFTDREAGAPAVIELLRGVLGGTVGFVAFCQVVAELIGPYGTAPAFAAASAIAVIVQALTIYAPLRAPVAQPIALSAD